MARVVVIGAGIAGLTTAESLAARGHDVLVVEGRDRVGGVVAPAEVAGVRLDVGAESVRITDDATAALERVGLAQRQVRPEPVPAQLWDRGRLVPLPTRTYMGVPADAATTGGVLTEQEQERAAKGGAAALGEGPDADVSVAAGISAEYGRAVVDRLVEPLLGGVYAGRVDELSLPSTMGGLWQAAREHGSLAAGARALVPPADPAAAPASGAGGATGRRGPALLGVDGGVHQLPLALADRVRAHGGQIRLGTISRGVERTAQGWRVVVGPTTASEAIDADAVVVATPAPAATRLLRDVAPVAADALAEVETASMAVVTIAVPAGRDGWDDLPGSGFLVPAVDGRLIKASTFVSTKWAWAAQAAREHGLLLLRASVGRAGDVTSLQREDAELVRGALADVATALGRPVPQVADSHVQRWGGGLPQYTVGHRARVARVVSGLADLPGLAVTGATYEGVGIAAVIAHARATADITHDQLSHTKEIA
ncbi:protoporphyrinogen oxidase [Janibacter melonis]|uniref:protoporphyrinogen oxidase n=1 Tax=Janibacter melonis TaxID=262209 RepID=UPI001E427625|nr:protoporphyrinogen oxidase [Janibacter melonis]MCB5990327.1 protoporphyrinogen oxidase [Janibacter melonis]